MPAHIAEFIACLGAETFDGVVPLSPFEAESWHLLAHFFHKRISQSTCAAQLSYLLVGALCLERCDCVFET